MWSFGQSSLWKNKTNCRLPAIMATFTSIGFSIWFTANISLNWKGWIEIFGDRVLMHAELFRDILIFSNKKCHNLCYTSG